MRKQNIIERMTKEELRTVVKEIKRRKEISIPVVPRQGSIMEKESTPAARCLKPKRKTRNLMPIVSRQNPMIEEGGSFAARCPVSKGIKEVKLPEILTKELLDYFGARNFGKIKGYIAEWVVKRLKEEDKKTAVEILRVWVHQSRRKECNDKKVDELNRKIDGEVIFTLQSLEQPPILRQMGYKQLNIKVRLTTINTMRSSHKSALIDLGYTNLCISRKFVQENKINTQYLLPVIMPIEHPIDLIIL